METNEELKHMVKTVADTVNALGNGENPYADPDYGYEWGEDGRTADGTDMSPMDVFMMDEVLDLRFIVDSSARYLGAQICVTLGGPNIWIDTTKRTVLGCWGTDVATAYLTFAGADALDAECGENWASIRGSY